MKAAISLLTLAAATISPAPAGVVDWVKTHAVPIAGDDIAPSGAEARAVHSLVADARLIGLGEPFHGHQEPLAYRNRLVRYLVAHEGLSAVAFESGIADTEAASAYVLGGPGDARAAVAPMSWRFGTLAANIDLIGWMRRWNDAHPRARVRVYGIDTSGGDDRAGFGNTRVALDQVDAFLARAALPDAAPLRAELGRLASLFSPAGYAGASAEDRGAIVRLPTTLTRYFAAHRVALARATSTEAEARAERIALDTATSARIIPIYPADASAPTPALLQASAFREAAMVANTQWVLTRERRVLLFQSNSHIAKAALEPVGRPPLTGFESTGTQLRHPLGDVFRVILFTSALGKRADDETIGTIDRVFAAASGSPVLLDIRHAPSWWAARQTMAHGGVRVNALTPREAADAIVFVDRLTPAAQVGATSSPAR